MRIWRTVAELLLALIAVSAVAQKAEFNWNWRDQEVIGHHDASLGNTSKLTEADRAALLDAIVLRLQKPMTDAGYDDDRIREIASTTRIRFVDFGGGKPLLFATSLGMEGGCDPLGNCPLWIFRRSSGGFVSLLDVVAASYTLQSSDGELVLMHHVSQKQSGLEVYRLDDGKLNQGGCYTANWPAPSDDPTKVSDPEIVPCKEGTAEPASLTPEAKPEITPSPDGKPPLPDAPQPQAGEMKPEAAERKEEPAENAPAEPKPKADTPEAKPDAPPTDSKQPPEAPAQSDTKPAPDAPPSDSKPVTPEAPRAGEAKSETPDHKQPPAPDNPAEAQPKPDTPEAQPKPDTPEAQPDTPSTDSKQPAPDASPQSDSKQAAPDTPPSDSKPATPDAPQAGEAKPDSSDQKQQPAPDQASPNPQTPPEQPQAPPQSDAP
jgi:hypothetical protein